MEKVEDWLRRVMPDVPPMVVTPYGPLQQNFRRVGSRGIYLVRETPEGQTEKTAYEAWEVLRIPASDGILMVPNRFAGEPRRDGNGVWYKGLNTPDQVAYIGLIRDVELVADQLQVFETVRETLGRMLTALKAPTPYGDNHFRGRANWNECFRELPRGEKGVGAGAPVPPALGTPVPVPAALADPDETATDTTV